MVHWPCTGKSGDVASDFINKHFQMLGLGNGDIKFCRAMANGTYAALDSGQAVTRPCGPGQSGHPNPTTHDDDAPAEILYHLDGGNVPNHYEAASLFNSKYYAVGVGVFATPKDVVKTSFGTINWFYSVNSPPHNVGECTITPWVEAP